MLHHCDAGTRHGTSSGAGGGNMDQGHLMSLFSLCWDEDVTMMHLAQPDAGVCVTPGTHCIPPGDRASALPLVKEHLVGQRFFARSDSWAHPTWWPATKPPVLLSFCCWLNRGDTGLPTAGHTGTHPEQAPAPSRWWIYTGGINPVETPYLWGRLKPLAPKWGFPALALIKTCEFVPPRGSHRPHT